MNPIFEMNDELEKKLWKDAIFVFDTCALHAFYFLHKSSREEIYKEIFEKNKGRFWIPGHVEFEFLKNRKKIIEKPISSNYTPLENQIKGLRETINVKSKIKTIIESSSKNDNHPYIEQTELNNLSTDLDEFLIKIEEHEKKIIDNIKIAKKQVSDVVNNDDVLDSINNYFLIGDNFTFNEIIDITKEGKHRFEFRIPPGYGDYYAKEKKGTQIFGDLIIWKQILKYSKENSKDIIFITNDNVKDSDWCEIDKKSKRILNPRHELIKEIKDYSNVDFWMYNLEQFLFYSKQYTESVISQEILSDISSTLKNISNVDENRILNLLTANDFENIFREYLISDKSGLILYAEDTEITKQEKISPSAYLYGFTIEETGFESIDKFELFEFQNTSISQISLSMIFNMYVNVDFCTDYGGYIELVEDYNGSRIVELNNMKGDGYCNLSEARHVKVMISLDIYIESDNVNNTMKYLKDMTAYHKYFSPEISYLNIELL